MFSFTTPKPIIMAIILQALNSLSFSAAAVLLGIPGLIIYFMPAFIGRKKRSSVSILLMNHCLGWTIIGWIGALIWACKADTPVTPSVTINNYTSVISKVEHLERLASMFRNGVLSEEEFEAEKQKLLA